ncbi:MAG: hypothetical protein OIF48_06685 [Silicimonas sp.]|nr:hypothetical protein [Silicimonas sp.]
MSNDTFTGGNGNDTIFAGIGDDLIAAGPGADVIFDGAGNDTALGDDGDDTFWLASGSSDGSDDLDGGNGSDTLVEDLRAEPGGSLTVTVDLTAGSHFLNSGASGVDSLARIENYTLLGDFDVTALGNGAANIFVTAAGNDSIAAESGADNVSSGAGQDTLLGGWGNDTLDGGAGDDRLFGHENDDLLIAGGGRDTLVGASGDDTLLGGAGNDTLIGDAGADSMDGGDAGDRYTIGTGDLVTDTGASGFDEAYMALGAGSTAIDLAGWSGLERIIAGEGDDTLDASGGAAGAVLWGQGGDDVLIGTAGADTISGGSGADQLNGGGGADRMRGDGGNDSYQGGAGNDTFLIEQVGDVVTDGGSGYDTAIINQAAGLSIAVGAWVGVERVNGFTGDDVIDATGLTTALVFDTRGGNDTMIGGSGADTFFAASGDDHVSAGAGHDVLVGDAGDDTLLGGAGSDTIIGDAGADSMDGGEGSDRYTIAEGDLVTDTGGAGYDEAYIALGAGSTAINLAGWSGVERVIAGNGNDSLNAASADPGLILLGEGGDDVMTGTAGADTLGGGTGNDRLIGGGGADRLRGDGGNDTYFGGDGDDILLIEQVGDVVSDGGSGYDTAVINQAAGLSIAVGAWVGVERVNGYLGDDVVDATGLSTDLVFDTRGGDDSMIGGAGNDTFFAASGDDLMLGNAGNDALIGGAGADSLRGGTGDDFLKGEGGADRFIFEAGFGRDRVNDFADGMDLLDFTLMASVTGLSDLVITADGANSVITLTAGGGDQITLVGVDSGLLDAGDFLF